MLKAKEIPVKTASTAEEKADRALKKAEKRLKQREQNIDRAQKMHDARMADNGELSLAQPAKLPKINIGCSGWFYWDWKGVFYPEDLPNNKWFDYYSDHFKTVELNAPFYSWPTISTVKSWVRQSQGKNFIYTVKVCELITHIKNFTGTKTLIKDFGYIADLLGPQMGCFLFQLPPSFQYTPARLQNILSQLDHTQRNVVEFRHKSWWNDDVYKAFKKHGTIFCSCSGPKLPDELIKTADEIYIRFHGTEKWYKHKYSGEDMAKWADRIKESGAKRVWVYFNNDYDGYAIEDADQLLSLLN